MRNIHFVLILCLSLCGCYDRFYGPKMRSEYPYDVNVDVRFQDGFSKSFIWPRCQTIYLGKENAIITAISFRSSGKELVYFDSDEVNNFISSQEKSSGYPVLVVDESGLRFSSEKECK